MIFKSIFILFKFLDTNQKKQFFCLQILIILTSLFEILGVASIAPFMALIGDMSLLESQSLLASVYKILDFSSPKNFAVFLGIMVLLSLTVSCVISIVTNWRLAIFATKTGTQISNQLYQYYITQNWLFHTSNSSAKLTKQLANECQRVTSGILLPVLQVNARIMLVLGIFTSLLLYNPVVALIGVTTFSVAYFILFKIVRKKLHLNGYKVSKSLEDRFRLMNEGFGGIKDTLVLGRKTNFINRYNEAGDTMAMSLGVNVALAQTPRFLMELISFGTIISLVLFLYSFFEGEIGVILPIISLYALAGFKLLPAFQKIYAAFAQIKGNLSALDSIKIDLLQSLNKQESDQNHYSKPLKINSKIELQNIMFCYPSKQKSALRNISIEIKVNSVVGIVGPSGSGKSTTLDILLGLLKPDEGKILVDGKNITSSNLRRWQDLIGYVPQSIFLSEGSILENIAFGLSKKQINMDSVRMALKLANLDEFVSSLKDGVDTLVGERGVQLSGGQRQRIGIARALYGNPPVLIFDEATSSLDGLTEKIIMDAIHDLQGLKTIIMIAHRLKTVERCEKIFYLDDGVVIDNGTYHELERKNYNFRKMANFA